MSEELEAMGTAVEGGLIAKALEEERYGATGGRGENCLNCDAVVTGSYCANCGQPLRVHRSIGAFWHDILHGVLHFEGKFWRTFPLLAWKPGDLTRRYVHGERAKFISPMALFLFSVFMMFAVFSFLGDPFSSGESIVVDDAARSEILAEASQIDERIEALTAQLPESSGSKRAELQEDILRLKKGRNVMATISGDPIPYPNVSLGDGDAQIGNFSDDDLDQIQSGLDDINEGNILNENSSITTGSPQADRIVKDAVKKVTDNPELLLYKLKANGYKFAWLLIPISLPFVWLTVIGRRGYHFYDHAVFTTYSISFMSLLFIFCAVLAAIGVDDAVWGVLLIFYPPFHMYRQLRHAYQMSRPEALVRVSFLLVFTVICLALFFAILLALGVLG
ncbi:DUF3667 domain-containing protein [Tritonibacter scottomollicae]|uniref:DUF3667 domain-containing protein n=1 Tax=Tritonibacter scottomollicae TaxID=483013 RepID=UPI003AA860F6